MHKIMDKTLLSALIEMTEHCQQMQTLLAQDKNQFGKNDLSKMTASNQEKTILIEKINALLHKIGLSQSKHIDSADSDNKTLFQMQNRLAELKSEITKCYQSVIVNNNIVHANLQNLKDIWDRLTANQSDKVCVYDHPGRK